MVESRRNPVLREFWQRLQEVGKPKIGRPHRVH